MIEGKTEVGHVLFNSILLPMEAAKAVLGIDAAVDPKKFTFGGGLEIGGKKVEAQGAANDIFAEMQTMVANTEQPEINKLWMEYITNYVVNQGIDLHAYFGNKKDQSLP